MRLLNIKKIISRENLPRKKKESNSLIEIDENRRRQKRHLLYYGYFFFATLFFIFIIWIFLRSPLVIVKNIQISGGSEKAQSEALTAIQSTMFGGSKWKYFLGYRHISVWPDRVGSKELKFAPHVKEVKIQKENHIVKIYVTERVPIGVWCFSKITDMTECAWYDNEGTVIERAPYVEGNLITRVSDYSQNKIPTFGKILPVNLLTNYFSVVDSLAKIKLHPKDIVLKELELQEIEVKTYEGPSVHFSLRFKAEKATAFLESLMREAGGSKFKSLEYVDFRVENRAYYK